MKKLAFIFLMFAFACTTSVKKNSWTIGEKYMQKNGQDIFLSGVNYIPSHGWLTILEQDWNPASVEKDLASLEELGINCIRFCPLWPLIQLEPNRLNEKALGRLDTIIDIAYKHHIYVQIAPIAGWMSGATFLPSWADGDVVNDTSIVASQKYLLRSLASHYKDHPGIFSYDIGNETNVLPMIMKLIVTREQVASWMRILYDSYRTADTSHPVTNGIGSGYDQYFVIQNIAKASDYMSVHSYPPQNEPKISMRVLHGPNLVTTWAQMTGKPTLIQETGCSEEWLSPKDIHKYLRITYMSGWGNDAIGYMWWCSNDIDKSFGVKHKGLNPKYSHGAFLQGTFPALEQVMGLIDVNGNKKPYALEYKKCIEATNKLGTGWNELQPTAYIVISENAVYNDYMNTLINPYVLLKQNHFNVKMLFEGQAVPANAAAVILPGIALSDQGKASVNKYLVQGGQVFQSWYNDLIPGLSVSLSDSTLSDSILLNANTESGLIKTGGTVYLPYKIKFAGISKTVDTKIILSTKSGKPVMVKANVGRGTCFYLAANLESALVNTIAPWDKDEANKIYSVLAKQQDIEIDNKFIEIYHKIKDGKQILLLLNHADRNENVAITSAKSLKLSDFISGKSEGTGKRISLKIGAGDYRILAIE